MQKPRSTTTGRRWNSHVDLGRNSMESGSAPSILRQSHDVEPSTHSTCQVTALPGSSGEASLPQSSMRVRIDVSRLSVRWFVTTLVGPGDYRPVPVPTEGDGHSQHAGDHRHFTSHIQVDACELWPSPHHLPRLSAKTEIYVPFLNPDANRYRGKYEATN